MPPGKKCEARGEPPDGPDMGICGDIDRPLRLSWDPKTLSSPPTEEVPGVQKVEISLLFSLTFQRGGLFFVVDICDSAFSLWGVLLLLRPSRDHGAG